MDRYEPLSSKASGAIIRPNTCSVPWSMAGGMDRRRADRPSLHERIHGRHAGRPGAQRMAAPPSLLLDHRRARTLPALLLDWRRVASGWQGRVVRPVFDRGAWVVVEEWLPAELLASA